MGDCTFPHLVTLARSDSKEHTTSRHGDGERGQSTNETIVTVLIADLTICSVEVGIAVDRDSVASVTSCKGVLEAGEGEDTCDGEMNEGSDQRVGANESRAAVAGKHVAEEGGSEEDEGNGAVLRCAEDEEDSSDQVPEVQEEEELAAELGGHAEGVLLLYRRERREEHEL